MKGVISTKSWPSLISEILSVKLFPASCLSKCKSISRFSSIKSTTINNFRSVLHIGFASMREKDFDTFFPKIGQVIFCFCKNIGADKIIWICEINLLDVDSPLCPESKGVQVIFCNLNFSNFSCKLLKVCKSTKLIPWELFLLVDKYPLVMKFADGDDWKSYHLNRILQMINIQL